MSAPVKTTHDLMVEGWHWRQKAWECGDQARVFEWVDAFNTLLDAYLVERPELRVQL